MNNSYDQRLCQSCRLQSEPIRSAFRGWETTPDYSSNYPGLQQQQQPAVEFEKTKQLNFGLEAKPEPNKNAELNVQCFEYNGEIYAKEIWKQKERSGR